jgi:guanylate kinase
VAEAKAAGGRVFVLSSPSGGGKTTLVEQLKRVVPTLTRSISVTTRAPRVGEQDGRDYRFVSVPAFHKLRRSGDLLEWARVHGAYYGTQKQPVLEAMASGRHLVLNIDVQGARQVRRALGRRAVLIFLLPPSLDSLRERLQLRRTEDAPAIRRRLAAAKREMRCASWYDFRVVNDRLDQAVREVKSIMLRHATKGA